MTGCFSVENQDYIVSNMRFYNLIEWAIEASESIEHKNSKEYIDKMKYNYKNKYSPVTSINLHKELNEDERLFWSEAFLLVGTGVYQMKYGNPENIDRRPEAIGDAIYISRMLKGNTGILTGSNA